MPKNSTHLDYKANALERSRARRARAVKRFAQTIFSRVFGAIPPAFTCIRKGFVGQAVCRKTRASVSPMSDHQPPVRRSAFDEGGSTLNQIRRHSRRGAALACARLEGVSVHGTPSKLNFGMEKVKKR
jgi:hypothetical protein